MFRKETKEEKQTRKTQEILTRYGLEDLTDPRDQAAVRNIATELAGNGLMTLGITFNGKAEDVAKINLLRTLVEQNWIIIRQLDGEGIRYELVDFVKTINTGKHSAYISEDVSEAITGVMKMFYTQENMKLI